MTKRLHEDRTPVTEVDENKGELRKEIDQQMKEYLDRGGKINVIPAGLSSDAAKAKAAKGFGKYPVRKKEEDETSGHTD